MYVWSASATLRLTRHCKTYLYLYRYKYNCIYAYIERRSFFNEWGGAALGGSVPTVNVTYEITRTHILAYNIRITIPFQSDYEGFNRALNRPNQYTDR